MQYVSETHTKFAILLSWCAGKSDDNILGHLKVDSLFRFWLQNHSFLTVYKECQSISLQAHCQLYPLLPGEGISPREEKARKALSASFYSLVVQTQSVIEGGGDDL